MSTKVGLISWGRIGLYWIPLIIIILNFHSIDAKPANTNRDKLSSPQNVNPVFTRSQPDPSARSHSPSVSSSGRQVLTSLQEDGTWRASARLPTSSQSGGNDHSRYKIRRDGSLSLSLQSPTKPLSPLSHIGRNHDNIRSTSSTSRQYSPSELRSFSVVISDVDVTGNYNKNIHGIFDKNVGDDSYSKAGVSSYHLKSNSIHRMNASWKLKSGHSTPSSNDLLEFLAFFANNDGRAIRSGTGEGSHQQQKLTKRKILGRRDDVNEEHDFHKEGEEAANNQPFLTWSESSRNIPLSSSTELIETVRSTEMNETLSVDGDDDATTKISNVGGGGINSPTSNSSSSTSSSNEQAKVLHDLLSTLEKLNENVDDTLEKKKSKTVSSSLSSSDGINNHAQNISHHDKGKEGSSELQLQQTDLDHRKNSTEKQVLLVDEEEMAKSLQKKGEKEGELFVENDEAKVFDSNGNTTTKTTHNSRLIGNSSSLLSLEDKTSEKKKRKRNAKSALFDSSTTKSTNRNDHVEDDENEEYYDNGNNNNNGGDGGFNSTYSGRSTSATSLLSEMRANNSTKRMRISDPQQTASDLKKLMSLILKSEGNTKNMAGLELANTGSLIGEENRKSGAQVVNIVITPNQETQLKIEGPPHIVSGPQKILFLKTPQVKQMLDIALTDPAVSSAAQKIAAALEANPFPNPIPANIDHNFGSLPGYIVQAGGVGGIKGSDEVDTQLVPDGFPISGTGFLHMNNPNLQFHQALHHMVVNGTTPTSINATTKTNVINIFVINFKESSSSGGNSAEETGALQHQMEANQSPFRINIKPSQRPTLPLPISVKPLLIKSVSTTPSPSVELSSLFFNNKMGLAAAAAEGEDDEAEPIIAPNKNFDTAHQHHHHNHHTPSNSDKINIFDLLPGDIGTVTDIQYAPGVENDSQKNQTTMAPENNSKPSSSVTMRYSDYFADFLPDRSREPPGNENPVSQVHNEHDIFSILSSHRPKRPTPHLDGVPSSPEEMPDSLPPALAHLKWIFKNQPPPKPHIMRNQELLKRKGQIETDDISSNVSADSIMNPEETTNFPLKYTGSSTQELVDFLMKLQNVTKPLSSFDLNELHAASKNDSTSASQSNATATENDRREHIHSSHHSSSSNDTEEVIHYTTKRPAFWKFGNKLPVGSFSGNSNDNNEDAMNNRIRKLLTAFGYSAIPTIAAGAAATWPFWVPLVATGRRKRSTLYSSNIQQGGDDNSTEIHSIPEMIERKGQSFKTNAMIKSNNSNYTALDEKSARQSQPSSPSTRQLLSKSTKNSRREGSSNLHGEKKWIKVDVITTSSSTPFPSSSSPTLHDFGEMNGPSHAHDDHDGDDAKNNRNINRNGENVGDNGGIVRENLNPQQKQRHDEKQQLDLPLIKDFLKNVLHSEFHFPTKGTTSKPSENNNKYNALTASQYHFISPSTTPSSPSQYPIFDSSNNNNFSKLITKNGPYTHHLVEGDNKNVPFFRPSSTTSPLSLSPEIILSRPQFTTPSHSSVYIHNRGDGTTSAVQTTPAPPHYSTAASLVQWLNENNNKHYQKKPWGPSFGNDPDKIGTTSSSISSTFANTVAALSGHNDNNQDYYSSQNMGLNNANHFYKHTNKLLQNRKLADSIRAAESITTRKTDMTNNGRRTKDFDSTVQPKPHHQNQEGIKQQTAKVVAEAGSNGNFPPVRSQRRLHKWTNDKTDELNEAAEVNDDVTNNDENEPLVQSLSAMASHLINTKSGDRNSNNNDEDDEEEDEIENLENSSERDVYLTEKGHGVTGISVDDKENDTEETASEEDSTDQNDIGLGGNHEKKHGSGDLNDGGGEEDDNEEDSRGNDKISPKLKSDHYATTPKGLTTWSAVNGPSQIPMYNSKVTVQKIPLEYTISSVLSFSTERPPTTQEMVVIKERVTTTDPSTNKITTKVNLLSPSSTGPGMKNKRRPYNKNNKKVAPTRFVKPQLEEVTAEVASIDDTHVVYKTKITTEAPEPKSTGVTDYYDRFTTKKPLWPYQMTTRRLSTKRPAFSRITSKPKNPYLNKKPQLLTTPTTTTPASTTTYMRNPQTAIMTPISGLSLSLADIPFMDFVRSQIIPRIGLTLISFMTSAPLLMTLLGAAGLRRRKRSLSTSEFSGKALFERLHDRRQTDQFDFSTVQKKLEDALMKQPTRRRIVSGNDSGGTGSPSTSFDLITEAFRHLTRWWTVKNSVSSKSRSVNNSSEGKQQSREI